MMDGTRVCFKAAADATEHVGKYRQQWRQICAIALLTLTGASTAPSAAQWYEDDQFECEGVGTVVTDYLYNVYLKSGLPLKGHPATGRLYVELPKSEVEAISKRPGKNRLEEQYTLKPNDAKALREHFGKLAEDSKLPFILTVAGWVTGTQLETEALKAGVRATLGVFGYLIRKASSTTSATQLATLFAEGGVLHTVV